VTNKEHKARLIDRLRHLPFGAPHYTTPALTMEKSLALFAGCADVRFTGFLTI